MGVAGPYGLCGPGVAAPPVPSLPDRGKEAAARAAAGLVRRGMRVALGTGSTSAIAIQALAERLPELGAITAVASSHASEALARAGGISIEPLREGDEFAVMLDGADEVTPSLDLTKGGGGALFREKLLARQARELIIAVDASKLVDRLGARSPIPVEIVPFARPLLLERFRRRGFAPALRTAPDGAPWRTENGNEILDLKIGAPVDPRALDAELHAQTGVIETGLFLGMAHRVLVGYPDGRVEERAAPARRTVDAGRGSPNP